MADVKVKMEKEIERLKVGITSLRSKLEDEKKPKDRKNEKDARSKREVNSDAHDGARYTKNVQKCELGSSFLEMDGLLQHGCFLANGINLLQERETKLSKKYIHWIRAIHFFMKVGIG
ncbi:hypothetical protein FHG87_006398 [Trinorchestia longiramus]|nr:hypothetical protein FHG87_006398 [Trinorchestia longiramus]